MVHSNTNINRRQLVKGLGAALVAAPWIVGSNARGQNASATTPADMTASTTASTAANERLTVGIIGAGKMAHEYHFSELLKFPDVQIVAVCDVDTNRREAAKKRVEDTYASKNKAGFKGCDAINDFRDLIARKDIDAVLIATPDHWHAIPLIEACKAGKDVYCEKPLTLTIAEAKLCIDAARKFNRVVQAGSQQRSNVFGQFRQACEFIRNGRIGKIRKVTVGVGKPPKPCDLPGEPMEPGLDWNLWQGYAPERPYNSILSPRGVHTHFPAWRWYIEYAGGSLADMGAHHFDIAQWALGMDESGPVKVIPPDDPKADYGAKFIYANGIEMVHVHQPTGCVFYGEEGTLYIDREKLISIPEEATKEPLKPTEQKLFESPGHHRNWIDCIRSRKRPLCDVEIGARAATICHLANLAYLHRRTFQWDPTKWQFVGNKQDNELLDRKRRDPWQLPKI
ncbi:MAG: Gfo/Idh/MocA family oxidoreductase [Phycisphaerae bacterium]|nr:Gfo/Idh/MocA family oxidoreductase [Phycisphaerae bacterium]